MDLTASGANLAQAVAASNATVAGLVDAADRAVAVSGALAIGLLAAAGLWRLCYRAWRSWRAPSILGAEALVGRRATVRRATGKTGWVLLDGALWQARSSGRPLRAHQTVRVLAVEGLELVVDPEEQQDEGGGAVVTALRARWR
jgi:membrane-bound ClpP family serine protease